MNIKYKNLRNDLQETLLEAGIKDALVPLESTCNVDLIPGLGSSPGEENGYLLQYPGLENSMDYSPGQEFSRPGYYSPWGHKESDMTELLSHTYMKT